MYNNNCWCMTGSGLNLFIDWHPQIEGGTYTYEQEENIYHFKNSSMSVILAKEKHQTTQKMTNYGLKSEKVSLCGYRSVFGRKM